LRTLLLLVLLALFGPVLGHDLITAELAEGYLNKATKWQKQSVEETEKPERAKALLRIGVMLDEIRGYLNRDLAVHGKVQGLASNYLVAELDKLGTPLSYSGERRLFIANSGYYRSALELGLNRVLAREARLRLLRGEFYDSFDVDPLQTTQSMTQLQEQIYLADELNESVNTEPDLEEVRFIAAILYARAASLETGEAQRRIYLSEALVRIDAFSREYPDSLRSAAMPVMREALSTLH